MKRLALVILDGWGIGKNWGANAILAANTPNYNKILRSYPNTSIHAHGECVGLPGDEVGNSEVGHMNLGAGKIVEQDISTINKSINDGSFYENKVLKDTITKSKQDGTSLHLMGIISDGGIHSHIVHIFAILKMAKTIGHDKVYIHGFTDGRDTDQMQALEFINKIQIVCENLKVGEIATLIGRSYLDRKGNWERTRVAYEAIVNRKGNQEKSAKSAISNAYKNGQVDEDISPRIITKDKIVNDGDACVFFHFRSDRTKQLTQAFLDPKFNEFNRTYVRDLEFVTFIPYGVEIEINTNAKSAFKSANIKNTLSRYYAELGAKQFHIAETEKFAHVTYFFNGNKEDPFNGEERMLVPSPDVSSYAEKPEMSSEEVKQSLIKNIRRKDFEFILCNFANGDMVGHTGDFKAALKAVESLDSHLTDIVRTCLDTDTALIITADHGNIEQMIDPKTGEADPEHTKNPVPLIAITGDKYNLRKNGRLSNVASTALQIIGESSNLFDPSIVS